MATLGFYNSVSSYPQATTESLRSIKEHNPNSPIYIAVDGNKHSIEPYTNLSSTYKNTTVSAHYEASIGYCPYNRWQIREWLQRMFLGVSWMNTTHFCLWEDDILCTQPVTVDDSWECAGHVITHGNKIPSHILDEIYRFSGIKPETDYYGAGGGSIFRTKTFVDNYWMILDYITSRAWDIYQKYYWPQAGYIDCFMVLYYLLCGKSYTPNPNIINLWPTDYTTEWEDLKKQYGQQYQLLHNTKRYY
jgi:hypothetical protein